MLEQQAAILGHEQAAGGGGLAALGRDVFHPELLWGLGSNGGRAGLNPMKAAMQDQVVEGWGVVVMVSL